MRRVLIVSPHFPPTNAPDAHRVRTALNYLREAGWDPTILCVDPRDVTATRDEYLAQMLPPEIRVERVRAWPLALTASFGMRSLGWRAWRALDKAGRRLIRELHPDLVFFSTTQFLLVTLGARWLRDFGVPFVIDLQDPWLTDYYARPGSPRPPGGWKYRLAHALAVRLEKPAFHAACGFVSVSPVYLQDLQQRYPWFARKPQTVIPFGIDETEPVPPAAVSPAFNRETNCIHWVSVGAIGPIMMKAVHALCAELAALRGTSPSLAARLRLHFVGTSYASGAQPSVLPIARQHGVEDLVQESPARIAWHSARQTLRAADAIVILTSDDAGYTPSKLAGCFLAERPVLIVTGATTAAARLNDELGLGERLDPAGGPPGILAAFLEDLAAPQPRWRKRRNEQHFFARHTARARTHELCVFFDRVMADPKGPR